MLIDKDPFQSRVRLEMRIWAFVSKEGGDERI